MVKKAPRRLKHVPQRTCVGCRQVLAKRELIRLVRTPEGVKIDPTSKLAGRGAYLHDQRKCWEVGLKGALSHALKTALTEEECKTLQEFASGLPEEEEIRVK